MIKWGLSLALAATAFAVPVQAAEEELTVVNATGYTISELYISPTNTNSWEEDVLGSDVLPDATRLAIDFSHSAEECLWDMKVIYDDEEEVYWQQLDLCELSTVVLHYNDQTGDTWATTN